MSLRNFLKTKTNPPGKDSPLVAFIWNLRYVWLILIGLGVLNFFVPLSRLFYHSLTFILWVIVALMLLSMVLSLSALTEMSGSNTSMRARSGGLFQFVRMKKGLIVLMLLFFGGLFALAGIGVPWLMEHLAGPYICPPGYGEMTFKPDEFRIPLIDYKVAYYAGGYCSGSLGVFQYKNLFQYFIGLMGAYVILAALAMLAVLLVRLIQPAFVIASSTYGPNLRTVLVVVFTLGLWTELVLLPKQVPAIPHTISHMFNVFNYYNTQLHNLANGRNNADKLVIALEAYPFNVKRENQEDQTPLAVALSHNNLVAIDMLRRYGGDKNVDLDTVIPMQKRGIHRYFGITTKIMDEITCKDCKKTLPKRK